RQCHARGSQHLDQFNAREPGHIVVGDQQIVAGATNRLPAGGAILGGVDLVTVGGKQFGGEPSDVGVIVDNQNAGDRGRTLSGRALKLVVVQVFAGFHNSTLSD